MVLPLPPLRAQETAADAAPAAAQAAASNRYLFARGMLSRGFYQLAADEFRGFLQEFPRHRLAPQAQRGLVKALQGAGKLDEALAEIGALEKQWPGHNVVQDVLLDKGYILLQQGKAGEAELALGKISGDAPSETREAALYFIAQAREKQDDSQQAMRIYLSLASKPLDTTHKYRPYAVYAVMTSEAKTDPDRAGTRMEKLLAAESVPTSMKERAVMFCADTAYRRKDLERSEALYRRFLRDFPESTSRTSAMKGVLRVLHAAADHKKTMAYIREIREPGQLAGDTEVDFISGSALMGLGQFTAAIPVLHKVAADPNAPEAIRSPAALMYIRALVEARRFENAVDAADSFLRSDTGQRDRAEANYLKGIACYNLDRLASAVDGLEAVPAKGEFAEPQRTAHVNHLLADCYGRLGRHEDSARLYRILAGPPPYDEEHARHLLAAALAAENDNKKAQALADYEKVLRGTGKDSEAGLVAANAMVRLSFAQGDFEKTAKVLEELAEQTAGPTQNKALLTLALTYMSAGEIDKSEAALERAFRGGAEGALKGEIHFAAVRLALKQGQIERCLNHFAQILDLPQSSWPDFDANVLLTVQEEFFHRNNYAASEKVCRILIASVPPARLYAPTVRLAEIMIAVDRLEEAEKLLQDLRSANDRGDKVAHREAEILSLLGEVLLKQKKFDQAYRSFESSIEQGGGSERSIARSRWGMATLLKREGRLNDALKQAVGGFVIGNDPYYTPRAMLLAVDILKSQGRHEEADNTRRELAARFPAFAEKHPPDE